MRFLVFICILCNVRPGFCTPCDRSESLNITSGVTLSDGVILYEGIEYAPTTWYEMEEGGQMIRLGCPCIGRICVWKCCRAGEAYYNRSCVETDMSEINPFNPTVYKGRVRSNVTAHQHYFYLYSPAFEKYIVDSNSPDEDIYIQENGTLFELVRNIPLWHTQMMFCVDMMLDDSSPEPRLVAGVRYPDEEEDDSPALYITYAIGLMLSVPFLLATFLVYAFISELRNLHGLCLMAYCFGLIVAYSFLAYLKLHSGVVGVSMAGCYVIAFIVYYAFQTSFFWLNVMCFDIWRTFSGYRGGSSHKRREKKRFAAYAAYAWGVPVVLTAVTIAMQFSDDLPSHIIKPGLGNKRCWFSDKTSELVYFFIPVLVLVVCNVVLFAVTAHRIRSIRQETAILKSAESSRSDRLKKDKQRYGLYLKLFIVMGVNWTVEIISFAVGGPNWYWIVVDISNIVLGLFIFLIFVWKNKVRNLVRKKWRSIRGKRTTADSSLGRWATRSSSAPTEDTRVSTDESAIRLKDMR